MLNIKPILRSEKEVLEEEGSRLKLIDLEFEAVKTESEEET